MLILLKSTILKYTFVRSLKTPSRSQMKSNFFSLHHHPPSYMFLFILQWELRTYGFWVNPEVAIHFSAHFQTTTEKSIIYTALQLNGLFCKVKGCKFFLLIIPEILFYFRVSQIFSKGQLPSSTEQFKASFHSMQENYEESFKACKHSGFYSNCNNTWLKAKFQRHIWNPTYSINLNSWDCLCIIKLWEPIVAFKIMWQGWLIKELKR